ncbi:MAG: tryptophan synthase subunit alpha [Bacteroidetes bacterium]|nr:tryptophan synthase subunit alpha [Bacteroidota bacterium]
MNRLDSLFQKKKNNILSIFTTAGYPKLNDTLPVVKALQEAGVDFIEIGIPFSDPLADGPVIQDSSTVAIENGMTLKLLLSQMEDIRKELTLPILLMGYINPVLQYGIENFAKKCSEVGVDGIIIPDLPMQEYLEDYKKVFDQYNLKNIFLVTPQTSDERIRFIDEHSNGFIYLVSSSSTTGKKTGIDGAEEYLSRIQKMNLKTPTVVGFNISSKESFQKATQYANGAIIGSAFVKAINNNKDIAAGVKSFVGAIR